jgi:hypothetical protein
LCAFTQENYFFRRVVALRFVVALRAVVFLRVVGLRFAVVFLRVVVFFVATEITSFLFYFSFSFAKTLFANSNDSSVSQCKTRASVCILFSQTLSYKK